MMAPLPYYCINCGHEEPQVYKTYANGDLIKMLKCSSCGNLIDKYVEYDNIIIALNLLLQNKMAYRHILLNTIFEGFWKLGIIFLFCEAYCFWCFQKGVEQETSSADFYELEINFYRVLLRTTFGVAAFQISMIFLSLIRFGFLKAPSQFNYFTLWKGLCLCGFSEIFELVALIWEYSNTESRPILVTSLFILSNTNSYRVITGASKWSGFLTTIASFGIQKLFLQYYDSRFPY